MCSVRLAEHCRTLHCELSSSPSKTLGPTPSCQPMSAVRSKMTTDKDVATSNLKQRNALNEYELDMIWSYDHVNNLWIYDVNILIGTVHVTSVLFKASYTFAWWISRMKLLTVASRYCRYCETLNLVLALSKISQTVKGRRAIWAMRKWCDFQTCFINLNKCHTCFITQLPGICQVLGHIVAQSPWPPHRF